MSNLNLQLVREFFELHLFYTLTSWDQGHDRSPTPLKEDTEPAPQVFVAHAHPSTDQPDFMLNPDNLNGLTRAAVEVRAWHADRVYASTVENNPILGHVASTESRRRAEAVFGTPEFATILVIADLPASHTPRTRAIELLRRLGVDHVLEFPVLLRSMLDKIHSDGHYASSPTLQTMRLLKRYNLVRRQQLELAFPASPPVIATPVVDTSPPPEDTTD